MAATRQLFGLAWRESRTARRRLLLYMSSISLGVAALVAIDSFSEQRHPLGARAVARAARRRRRGRRATRRAPRRSTRCSTRSSQRGHRVSATATNFTSMALVPRTRRHAARAGPRRRAGLSVLRQHHHDAGRGVGAAAERAQRRRRSVAARLARRADRRHADARRRAKFVITGTLVSVPGRRRHHRGDRPARLHPRAVRRRDGAASCSAAAPSTRRCSSCRRATSRELVRLALHASACRQGANGSMRSAGYNESRLASAIDQLHDYPRASSDSSRCCSAASASRAACTRSSMRKIDTVAILRCLGATSWQVLAIYTSQAAVMGLIGARGGRRARRRHSVRAAARAARISFRSTSTFTSRRRRCSSDWAIGVWVALLFALRPLVALRRVSPLQALRREPDADALRRARWDPLRIALSLAIAVSVLGARAEPREHRRSAASASRWRSPARSACCGSARRCCRGSRDASLRPSWPFPLRQGVASLYRPGNQTRAVVLALGFGVFLMGTLYQVQHNILRSLDLRLGEARANVVFFDVQEDQRAGIDSIIRAGALRADRRDADRADADRVDQRTAGRATSSPTSRSSATADSAERGGAAAADATAATRAAARGRCAASSARPSATR